MIEVHQRRVAFHTLGCKLNYAETATLSDQFLERGFRVVEFGTPTDVVVINTCSVTERADRECRQLIRRALRVSPNACTIVVGCYAQLQPHEIATIDGVDFVLGANEKCDLFRYVRNFQKRSTAEIVCGDIGRATEFGPAYTSGSADRTRAFLKVQDGCDYNCAFCTIPLARGVSRSQPIEKTVAQARGLVREGYKELVLTGVNVGDYGRKIGTDLFSLLIELETIEGLRRIRLSSIEPNLLTLEMIQHIKDSEKICHHFHIPLQAGSDEILKLMRRRYLTGYYRDLIYAIKDEIPDAGIGADVIVGFPGESESLFEKTYLFLVDLPVSYLHVFSYSERENTAAIRLPGAFEPSVRAQRSEMLRILSAKKRHQFYEAFVDLTVPVLMEGTIEGERRIGHSSHYLRVGVPANSAGENDIVDVKITGVQDEMCVGVVAVGHTAENREILLEAVA